MGANDLKKRNGFVTFWLYWGAICSIINIASSIYIYQSLTNLGQIGMQLITNGVDISPFSEAIHPHVLVLQVIAFISGVLMCVFYIQLIKWKKSGFWGLVITALIVAIVSVFMMNLIKQDYALIGLTYSVNPIMQAIITPLSILILWAILQIKKDGESCWRGLE